MTTSLLDEYLQLIEQIPHLGSATRTRQVREQIEATGTYTHNTEELQEGSKVAWRNHARCNGRMNWRALRVLDFRDAHTPEQMMAGINEHLRYSTNGGKLRPVLSVFAPAPTQFQIMNSQLVRYAGYRQPDGLVLGDPMNQRVTDLALSLGWRPGPRGEFDVLPIIIRTGRDEYFLQELHRGAVMEVPVTHPDYPRIEELNLRWHANPAISDTTLSVGGIEYNNSPFSGWYISSEISARNFSDDYRYDKLTLVAHAMGLDTSRDSTFWRDRAVVELTYAVQWSFQHAGVHMIDHHKAAGAFVRHVEREHDAGRKVPTDWSWINPPISGSTTPTFHRSYDDADFEIRPNFYKTEIWPQDTVGPASAADEDGTPRCPMHAQHG